MNRIHHHLVETVLHIVVMVVVVAVEEVHIGSMAAVVEMVVHIDWMVIVVAVAALVEDKNVVVHSMGMELCK